MPKEVIPVIMTNLYPINQLMGQDPINFNQNLQRMKDLADSIESDFAESLVRITSVIVGDDARYTLTADCDSNYAVRGTKESYAPNEKLVTTPTKTGTVSVFTEHFAEKHNPRNQHRICLWCF